MPSRRKTAGRLRTAAVCALTLAPFALLVAWLALAQAFPSERGPDAPISSWINTVSAPLQFSDLWTPHEGRRLVVPKLVTAALARASSGDTRWLAILGLTLAAGFFTAVAAHWWTTTRRCGVTGGAWFLPLLSALVFSLHPWLNGFAAGPVQGFLCLLTVWGALCFLTLPDGGRADFLLALVLATMASWSHASGIMVWAAGLCALMLGQGHGRAVRMVVWTFAGMAVLATCFAGLEPAPAASAGSLGLAPVHALQYLGASLARALPGETALLPALLLGGAGAMGWVAAVLRLARLTGASRAWWLPYAALGLFGLCSAVLTAFSGLDDSLTPRHTPMAGSLWVSLFALAWLARPAGFRAGTARTLFSVAYSLAVLASVQGMVPLDGYQHVPEEQRGHRAFTDKDGVEPSARHAP